MKSQVTLLFVVVMSSTSKCLKKSEMQAAHLSLASRFLLSEVLTSGSDAHHGHYHHGWSHRRVKNPVTDSSCYSRQDGLREAGTVPVPRCRS